jgi:hypothetical protein
MATPAQKQYTEKPRKVLAAPYDPAAAPPQVGVCTCGVNPAFLDPHAHIKGAGFVPLAAGDLIVFDAVFPDRLLAVLAVVEFEAIYGPVSAGM